MCNPISIIIYYSNSISFFEKVPHCVFHKYVNTLMNSSLLERTNYLQTSCVSNVSQPWECMSTEISLIDQIFIGTVKYCAPFRHYSYRDADERPPAWQRMSAF